MKLNVPTASYYSGHTFFQNFDIPLRVLHVENSKAFPDHYHDFDELVIINGGEGYHFIGETEYEAQRGDVFFIRKGQHHRYIDPRNLNYINIIFDEKALFLDKSITDIIHIMPESGIRLNVIDENNIISIINRIDQELYDKKAAYTQMARAYLMQMFCFLLRTGKENTVSTEASTTARVKQIIHYLEEEGGPPVSVRSLADEAGTCVRNFHRIFRRLTGMSPVDFINRLRIQKACELLTHTDKTITSIASMVNYRDSNYFTRQFRNITGKTPSAYRESECF